MASGIGERSAFPTWSAEVLGLAAVLSTPLATCYASRLVSRLIQSLEWSGSSPEPPCGRGPVGLGLLALRAEDEEDEKDILLHSNAAYRRDSHSGCSVATVDTDDDLDFCLLTPQQAFGALGDHAPQYTKIFLNGLPFMADPADPAMVLSVDECAHRVRAAASSSCRGRPALASSHTASVPSSPCHTPPHRRLPDLLPLAPLPSLSGECSSTSCAPSACGSVLSDAGSSCSSLSSLSSPTSSISVFSQAPRSARSSLDMDFAGTQQKGERAEGSLPATPHGLSPADLLAAPAPSPLSAVWAQPRRSFSDYGDVDCGVAQAAVCAGAAVGADARGPHGTVAPALCPLTASRALSADAVKPRWVTSGPLAAPLPLPPASSHNCVAPASTARHPQPQPQPQQQGRASLDDSAVACTRGRSLTHHHDVRQSQAPHRTSTAGRPPLPPRACASSFRHGSGLVPPRPPRPLAAVTAVAAAAAAAAAPAGLCLAPALPLPDGLGADSAVPPALRYYLAQARAAEVQHASAPTEPADARAPGAERAGEGAGQAAAPVQPGFVRAAVAQLNTRRAQGVVCCHITPFAGSGTPRQPRLMSQRGAAHVPPPFK